MDKTFREILAEKDDEYTYYVRSTADIHKPELAERIRLSFMPYDIKSFESDTYRPIGRHNRDFPDEPNSPTYSIKVVTGLPLTPKFLETMALDARIHIAHLKIAGEEGHDLVNTPVEVKSSDAQALVGSQRLGEFIRELQAERKERMKMTIEHEVYESFSTTHRGLEDVLKKPVRKGYYMVEAFRVGDNNFIKAEGPFPARPEGNTYYDRLRIKAKQIVAEHNTGDSYGVKVLIEDVK